MRKYINKIKRKWLVVIVVLFVFVVLILIGKFGNWNAKQDVVPIISTDTSFDGRVRDFNDIYKKTLIALSSGQKIEAKRNMQNVLNLWLEIEKNFLNSKPKEYIITRNWEDKIKLITKLNTEAADLVKQGKYDEALKKLNEVRIKIKQLREENRVKNISNNFLSLSDEVDKISKIEKRTEAIKNLPELKIKFVEAKEFFPNNQEYQKMLVDFAQIISDIENSSDTTFIKNRDRLKPAFMVIYLKFG